MKIDEIERLAVAATAHIIALKWPDMEVPVNQWRATYNRVLADFIEQEKAERGGQ